MPSPIASPDSPGARAATPRLAERLASALAGVGLWPVRVLWALLPLLVGPGLLAALDPLPAAVSTTAEIGAWLAWFVGLVATLVPSALSCTALRLLAPACVVSPCLVGLAGVWSATTSVAAVFGLVVVAAVYLPTVGNELVNGSAYGSERRMALRPPAVVIVGPAPVGWVAWYAGIVSGPILIAAGRRGLGLAAVIIGVPVAVQIGRAFHQLSRRWLVFVPAGFVIHDYLMLGESILFQRRQRPSLGAAPTDDDGLDSIDLSGGALGLALLARAAEPQPILLRKGRQMEATTGSAFVFTPSLPGEALREARVRALRID